MVACYITRFGCRSLQEPQAEFVSTSHTCVYKTARADVAMCCTVHALYTQEAMMIFFPCAALNRTDAQDTDVQSICDTLVESLFSVFVTAGGCGQYFTTYRIARNFRGA